MPATLIQPSTVPGKLLYFTPPKDGSRPITRINEDANYDSRFNWVQAEHIVPIENIRGKEDSYTLNSAGFQYYHHKSKHTAFSNDEDIEREYYPESVELIKQLTGASKVVLFDHSASTLLLTCTYNHHDRVPQLSGDDALANWTLIPRKGSLSPTSMLTRQASQRRVGSSAISQKLKRQNC